MIILLSEQARYLIHETVCSLLHEKVKEERLYVRDCTYIHRSKIKSREKIHHKTFSLRDIRIENE